MPPAWTVRIPRTNPRFYIDSQRRLYHNRLSKLLDITGNIPLVVARLERYFDCLFIDEIQDLAGHDFNFLAAVASGDLDMLFVGDFYQHTFDTSRDGNVNQNLHADYDRYKERLCRIGLTVDETSLQRSYRCTPEICAFVTDQLGIEMHSHRNDSSVVNMVSDGAEAVRMIEDNQTVKLFYKEHYKHGCYSRNWGDSKGEDQYEDVCVVLNQTACETLQRGCLRQLAPQSRNKLYVACTRARGDLHLLPVELLSCL
jgi:DNA helicase II / ATP-dependent DNA helicase PcrA